jgi:hypothetical protein
LAIALVVAACAEGISEDPTDPEDVHLDDDNGTGIDWVPPESEASRRSHQPSTT